MPPSEATLTWQVRELEERLRVVERRVLGYYGTSTAPEFYGDTCTTQHPLFPKDTTTNGH